MLTQQQIVQLIKFFSKRIQEFFNPIISIDANYISCFQFDPDI